MSAAREYLNGLISRHLPVSRSVFKQRLLIFAGKLPGLRYIFSRVNFPDRVDDIRVGAAPANIAAHSFPDLFVGQFNRAAHLADVRRDIAGLTVLRFV